jgi:vacuolar-type H+-ATPase subunit F/Vma7
MKMAVLGEEDLVWGMMLAGIRNARITTGPDDTKEALNEWLRSPEIGVILLAGDAADQVRPFLSNVRKSKRLYPLIIEIRDNNRGENNQSDPIGPERMNGTEGEGSHG